MFEKPDTMIDQDNVRQLKVFFKSIKKLEDPLLFPVAR